MKRSAAAARSAPPVGEGAPRVHVESVGIGPPLVLLHGLAMHGGLFAPIVPALARRARVHVVDLPGHGWSRQVWPRDLDAIVAAVAAAVDAALALDVAAATGATRADALPAASIPLAVLGWSFGGLVAMHWAATHPGRIAKLVLVATTPSFVTRDGWPWAKTPDTLSRFGDELAVAWRLTLQRFLTLQVQGSDEGRRTLAQLRSHLFERGDPAPEALAATVAVLEQSDVRGEVASIAVPATLIAGTRDALVPIGAMRALARMMPHATLHEIEGAAHAPFLSHPQAFFAALDDVPAQAEGRDG